MKVHTTNYFNTLILIAEDCQVDRGIIPQSKGDKPTIASLQFEIINRYPYRYTSDEILFQIYAQRNDLLESERDNAWQEFFSKGQACFRSSPLAKRYGWGFHFNSEGKVAVYPVGSEKYDELMKNTDLKKLKAMRSGRK